MDTKDENGIVRPGVLRLMMETKKKLGPRRSTSFLVDSRAPPLSYTYVGISDQAQKRLQDEVDQVLEDCKGQVTYKAINETTACGYLSTVFNTIHNTIHSRKNSILTDSTTIRNRCPILSLVSLVWAGPQNVHRNKFTLLDMKVFLFYIFAKSSIPLKLNTKNLAMIPEDNLWLKIQLRNAKKAKPEEIVIPGTTMLVEKIPDRHLDN